MAAFPLAPARRPSRLRRGAPQTSAEKRSSQAEKKALRAHSLTGGNPTALFPRTPLPPRGRFAPRKIHPVRNDALGRPHPKDGRPSPPLVTRRPAMVPRCKTGTAEPFPVHRGKAPRRRPESGHSLRAAPAPAPDSTPNAFHGTVCRDSVRNVCPFQGHGWRWVLPPFLLTQHSLRAHWVSKTPPKPTTNQKSKSKTKVKVKSKIKTITGTGAAKGAGQTGLRYRNGKKRGLNQPAAKTTAKRGRLNQHRQRRLQAVYVTAARRRRAVLSTAKQPTP
jgi:hypothetical protein